MENNNSKPQIIESAVALFKEKGFDNVSIVDICKASGITRTTFYYHFQSKDEILISYLANRFMSQADMFAALLKLDNELERYYSLTCKLIAVLEEEGPEFCKQIMITALKNDAIVSNFFVNDEWCIPLLANCQKNGLVRADMTPEQLDQLCINTTLGLCFQWCSSNGGFELQKAVQSGLQQVLLPQ